MLESAGVVRSPARRATPLGCALFALAACLSPAELLYFTEFEDPPFQPGPDMWVGSDGWLGNNLNLGVHGIDDNQWIDADQTAYLGFDQPNTTFVVVAQPINHDPVQEGTDRIQIDTAFGIEDSTNGFRDSFFLTVYNVAGQVLAALRFSNELATFGIWRYDGNSEFDLGLGFIHGELHFFCVEIDLQNNLWKADLDGIPLFANAPFTATGKVRDFGSLAYEWQLTSSLPSEHGDNWMLLADTAVWAIPPGEANFAIDQVAFDSGGQPMVEFTGEPGWTYRVQYSHDLLIWHSDLRGSIFTEIAEKSQLQFSDPTLILPDRRWYRVVRSVTP